MQCFSERTKEKIDKLRWGKKWTKKAAFLQHKPYLPGQPIATYSRRPLPGSQANDGARQILLECMHANMKKQHIARHDAMMKMLLKGFTEGTKGSHCLTVQQPHSRTLECTANGFPNWCYQTLTFSTRHETFNLAEIICLAG